MIQAVNGHICIAPFPKGKGVETKRYGGIEGIAQHQELVSSKVLFGNERFPAGSTVYFEGVAVAANWTKAVHSIDGTSFLRAPEAQVILVSHKPEVKG